MRPPFGQQAKACEGEVELASDDFRRSELVQDSLSRIGQPTPHGYLLRFEVSDTRSGMTPAQAEAGPTPN